ncbi:hypothetical protein SCLCIDRAFT_1211874 [Scleroderma citrinum Foug A]|uniref:Uncharacterized protein n=1 Tax=Scleroderma citrinum Foug A TaxID=1036808 RepID=A0A0C3DZ77_9AGAM|nr:hypothetical protein SCLCIDRAFT_1211874 [Scleroderma citrinum Foug A]
MNGTQARLYLRKKREGAKGTESHSSQGTTHNKPTAASATSHPPVMAKHCARMHLAGRRDSCSGVQYPFFEEPTSFSPLQLWDEVKGRWIKISNTKPRPGKEEKYYRDQGRTQRKDGK